jgi:glutamyl-tRNA synthetase
MVKLRWMNSEYLKNMEDGRFYHMALPYLKDTIRKDLDFHKIAALIKSRLETFLDIKTMVDFFEELPDYDILMYTHKKMKTDAQSSLTVLKELLPKFEALEDYSEVSIENVIMTYIQEKGIKNGQGLWPIRTAVSGKQSTPGGAYEIMNILGKEESLSRINKAIEKLSE